MYMYKLAEIYSASLARIDALHDQLRAGDYLGVKQIEDASFIYVHNYEELAVLDMFASHAGLLENVDYTLDIGNNPSFIFLKTVEMKVTERWVTYHRPHLLTKLFFQVLSDVPLSRSEFEEKYLLVEKRVDKLLETTRFLEESLLFAILLIRDPLLIFSENKKASFLEHIEKLLEHQQEASKFEKIDKVCRKLNELASPDSFDPSTVKLTEE
ncbi:MAG: hypothetical protein ACFFD4_38000 [Candidatus Odinarchaeota archaeon]